jgi:hypothetical protein
VRRAGSGAGGTGAPLLCCGGEAARRAAVAAMGGVVRGMGQGRAAAGWLAEVLVRVRRQCLGRAVSPGQRCHSRTRTALSITDPDSAVTH